MGIIAPAWYLAPQSYEVAKMGWNTLAEFRGVYGEGEISGLEDAEGATFLLQLAGEFADTATKKRIWEAAEQFIEPVRDEGTGEFTLGLGLNEAHPRGQLNARMMAGWVCEKGAWSRIFNKPNFSKFEEPTVVGVDFPRIALSEARWDGQTLRVAAHAQNEKLNGLSTIVQVTNIASIGNWTITYSNGEQRRLKPRNGHLDVQLIADNQAALIQPES